METIERMEPRTQQCLVCEDAVATLGFETQTFNYGPVADGVLLSAKVPVWTCAGCASQYLDDAAEDIKHEAVCAHLGRLTPSEIKALRASFGMLQEAFSDCTGYGSASIKRWEAGTQIQSESVDKHLRLLRSLGLSEVTKRTATPRPAQFRTPLSARSLAGKKLFQLRPSAYQSGTLAA